MTMTPQKNAPRAVGAAAEGDDQNNISRRGGSIMTMFAETDEIRDAIRRWAELYASASEGDTVPWPGDVCPSWASSIEVGIPIAGEIDVTFDVQFEDDDVQGVGATVGVILAVVVDVDPARTRTAPGVRVGDFFVSDPYLSLYGMDEGERPDFNKVAAMARVMESILQAKEEGVIA